MKQKIEPEKLENEFVKIFCEIFFNHGKFYHKPKVFTLDRQPLRVLTKYISCQKTCFMTRHSAQI